MKIFRLCKIHWIKCSTGHWFGQSAAQPILKVEKNSISLSEISTPRNSWIFSLSRTLFTIMNLRRNSWSSWNGENPSRTSKLIKDCNTMRLLSRRRIQQETDILSNYFSRINIMCLHLVHLVLVSLSTAANCFLLAWPTLTSIYLWLFLHKLALTKRKTQLIQRWKNVERDTMDLQSERNA